jgi:hypothetical protein|nr:MAG TPA: hypothetical protein [Caudoviricetes sp.]
MRVISQDGTIDVPYENFVFSILNSGGGNYGIVAVKNAAEPPEVFMNSLIATYSAKEKAIKAMEMLREAYAGMPIVMQNVDISEDVAEEFERLKKCGVMVRAENQPSKVDFINNAVFQFPQDEEIEV